MRTIYIDSDYKCYAAAAAGRTAVGTDFFDDKCDELVEGYRFVPSGQTWTREDGQVFEGEMYAPWKPFAELDAAQRAHERQLLADALADRDAALAALSEMGVSV